MAQWLTFALPLQGAQVRSLVRELRSHRLCCTAKKNTKKTTTTKKNDSSRNSRASGEITIGLELYPVPELSKLTSHIQRTGAQGSQARRRNKNYPYWKERVKLSVLIILFIEYPRDPHNEY